jgi:hypothetical protein
VSPDKWYHIAFVKDDSTWNVYVDWTLKNTWTNTGAIDATWMTKVLIAWKRWFKWYMDELRFTKWAARWNWNFMPPTTPY